MLCTFILTSSSPIILLFVSLYFFRTLYSFFAVLLSLFLPASISSSASVSSPLMDICSAQQKACGSLTHNPLVWRLVAVFIIIPNRCLIILQHPPIPLKHFLSLPLVVRPLPSFLVSPTPRLQIFIDGEKSNYKDM